MAKVISLTFSLKNYLLNNCNFSVILIEFGILEEGSTISIPSYLYYEKNRIY